MFVMVIMLHHVTMPVRTLLPVALPPITEPSHETSAMISPHLTPTTTTVGNLHFLRFSTHQPTVNTPTTPPTPFASENTRSSLPHGKKPVPVHSILLMLYPHLAFLPCGRKTWNSTSQISDHWHHPHVEANERLFFWTSDTAIQKCIELMSCLPTSEVIAYDAAVLSIIASSTCQVYGTGLMEWIAYCDSCHVPEANRFPAEHHHLQAFIALHPNSTMALWHHIHELPWSGLDNPLTKRFKQNAIVHMPSEFFLLPHPPITPHHLELLML